METSAGDTLTFSALGEDAYGNTGGDVYADWRLDASADSIGYFEENQLIITTPGRGRVLAESGSMTASSGMIVVDPGALTQLVLNIDPQQVVGQPLFNTAQIL
ncbi:hypothetical protein GF377_10765, partial [candidate division GN15 bacterium]|nr:hypothetical protein [candidate division GN15 bacterium]